MGINQFCEHILYLCILQRFYTIRTKALLKDNPKPTSHSKNKDYLLIKVYVNGTWKSKVVWFNKQLLSVERQKQWNSHQVGVGRGFLSVHVLPNHTIWFFVQFHSIFFAAFTKNTIYCSFILLLLLLKWFRVKLGENVILFLILFLELHKVVTAKDRLQMKIAFSLH